MDCGHRVDDDRGRRGLGRRAEGLGQRPDQLAQGRLDLGRRRRRGAGDEEQGTGFGRGQPAQIGPRPAGSPAAARARDWGVAKLTALGFANVHVEAFPKKAWLRDAEAGEIGLDLLRFPGTDHA